MSTGWGILGPGRIARTFARDLAVTPGAEIVAVGSRSAERAEAFAAEFGGTAHGSYEDLVADPAVDVVYVASPHGRHVEHVELCLDAGKAVLVEKPVTLRAADWERLVVRATERRVFLMEAMWTACHPVILALRDRLAAGEFGRPRHLHAELGFVVDAGPEDRLLDPELGAGALLDMGIYPLTLAHLLLGEAEDLAAVATLSESGIDLDTSVTGRYAGGAQATMTSSITSWSSRRAELATDRGRIVFEEFHHPTHAVFTPVGAGVSYDHVDPGEQVRIEGAVEIIGRGYGHEILEVQRCLDAGLLESPLVTHDQTLLLMRQLDDLRRQIGVHYPGDR